MSVSRTTSGRPETATPVERPKQRHSRVRRAPALDAGSPPVRPASRTSSLPDLIAIAAIAVAAVLVFHGALGYFFAQDDFEGLARARGLLPRLEGPWRLIGNQFYYDVMAAWAGLDARLYHASALAMHAGVSALVYALLRRRVSAQAAAVGAAFFAVHPALYMALYWVAASSSVLSLGLGLGAALLALRDGRVRWLALPLFAAALLAKETVLGLPLAIAATRLHERRTLRDPVLVALVAIAVVFGAAIAVQGIAALDPMRGAESPYRMAVGGHIAANIFTYLGWSLGSWHPVVRSFSDAVDPDAIPVGVAGLFAWVVGAAMPAWRRRGWLLGGVWFAVLILPLAMLTHHTYHYYLYGPLVGVAIAAAAVADMGWARIRESASRWAMAATAVILLAANGAALVRRIEHHPFVEGLRADPVVDRAMIARNVFDSLEREAPPPGARLRFWSPTAVQLEHRLQPRADPAVETYWERNVRMALLDGLGVRVLFPQVREVDFVRTLTPGDEHTWYAVYRIDGSLALARPAFLDSMLKAGGSDSPMSR